MGIAAPVSLLWLVTTLAYPLHRLSHQSVRQAALWLLHGLVLAAPWALPESYRFSRFAVALVCVLLTIRLWETRRQVLPEPARTSFAGFASYFLMVPDIVFSTTAEERRSARAQAAKRVGRGVAKGGALLTLLAAYSTAPTMLDGWVLRSVWLLWASYFAISGLVDLVAALVMSATGHGASEMFRTPPAATSPRDFWGRRWNLVFRNSAHRLIFRPLGGAKRPTRAVLVVFAWSALVHEYLVVAALEATHGHMSLFFALQCVAVLVQGLWRRRWPLPRPVAVALHLGWLVVTAPLFFAPLLQILPLEQLRLW